MYSGILCMLVSLLFCVLISVGFSRCLVSGVLLCMNIV